MDPTPTPTPLPEPSFITRDELKSVIYHYQIEQITEQDDDIVIMAITAAIDEAASYLRRNAKREWMDGRPNYDITATFEKTGAERNALLMEMVKSIAIWYVCRLCNVDMIYDNLEGRYDRAIVWLDKVSKGEITLDLPLIDDSENDPSTREPFRFGSRKKFNHE